MQYTNNIKMSEINNQELCEEDIHARHRRERKDFLCKIQALKKSATKGDKKKKKEIQEEIVRLEQEIDTRHSEELLKIKEEINAVTDLSNSVKDMCTNEADNSSGVQRVSKAQKRRDKKAEKEKERERLIEAQEKENINGVRNTEIRTLNSILKERKLLIHEVPSDGDCLYRAIAHQLQLMEEQYTVQKLRILTSQFLQNHMDDFIPFLSHSETEFLSESQYKEYCDQVANTSAWGGEVELRALSHVLKRPIEVIQAVGPVIVIGEEYDKQKILILTFHRHMYGLGEHYNSVKPFQNEIKQDS